MFVPNRFSITIIVLDLMANGQKVGINCRSAKECLALIAGVIDYTYTLEITHALLLVSELHL